MATHSLSSIRSIFESVFESGSRYQGEKIAIVVALIVVILARVVWAATVGGADNELGADWGFIDVEPLQEKRFFLDNKSGSDWTDVRLAINRNYLYTVDRIGREEGLVLEAEELSYFYYIPRPWGREDWESLYEGPRPTPFANSKDLNWDLIQVRTRQGRLDIEN